MAKHTPYGSLSNPRQPEHIELYSPSNSNSPYPSPNPTTTNLGYFDNNSSHALRPYTEKLGTYSSSTTLDNYRDDPYSTSAPWPSTTTANKTTYGTTKKPRRKGLLVGGIIVGLVLLIAAIAIPVYFFVIRKNSNASNGTGGSSNTPGGPNSAAVAITGGDGSQVKLDDGRTITYHNKFGGRWVYNPNDPFNNGARAQEWSPALNETFKYGVDKIRGVNLGGWLVTEPFIVPALYEKYYDTPARPVDEWTLTAAMAAAGSLESEMEEHYKTFITEEDFAQIAAAGLNYVRIPIGYWAIEVRENEPFLPHLSWTYFLKAIGWARKYGLRINLDIHALPGSQNEWNHSGRANIFNWLRGPNGIVNAQRSLTYVRTFAQFICQPQYKDVIGIFGIVNEPMSSGGIGIPALASWSFEAYNVVKSVCGTGEGHGPYVSLHHGFENAAAWVGLFPNADRVALDLHPYLAFNTTPFNGLPGERVTLPCSNWGNMVNNSQRDFGVTTAGEWSLAINDCGQWLNGVDLGTRIEGTFRGSTRIGSCQLWSDWPTWNETVKAGFRELALTSMDALQNSFFWTWKIGNSSRTGKVEMPFWSYSLGLANGWIPTDPRTSHGACARLGASGVQYTGPPRPWQTGGAGAGQIPAAEAQEIAWPPATLRDGGPVSLLPSYTPTGVNPTLPGPSQPAGATHSIDFGNGWFNPADTQGAYVPIEGCTYPDPWATGVPPPTTAFCPGRAKREAEPAAPTPLPKF